MPRIVPITFALTLLQLNALFGNLSFKTPEKWERVDPKSLPKSVVQMAICRSGSHFPASINLTSEEYEGSLDQYIAMIRRKHPRSTLKGNSIRSIKTPAGTASLFQEDAKTQWGKIRYLHGFLLADGTLYLVTCAASLEEFCTFYPQFVRAIQSLAVQTEGIP